MTLEDAVALSIFHYPSLYSRTTFEESKTRVLDHYFLTIGNGIDYINPNNEKHAGWFGHDADLPEAKKRRKLLSKKAKQKIAAGEKICRIYRHIHQDQFEKYGFISPSYDYKHEKEERTAFLSDFLKRGVKYLEVTHGFNRIIDETKRPNPADYEYFIEIYPDSNDRYIESLKEMEEKINRKVKSNYNWHPYPFSLKYTPMWDMQNGCFIPKDMIMPDWIEGIVAVYRKTLAWFEDDSKYMADNYYNWSELHDLTNFQIAWDKEPDKLILCKDYGIEPFVYTNIREMARAIVQTQRAHRIDECNQILAFYQ